MSTLEKLTELGLKDEFETQLATYIVKQDDAAKANLISLIDVNGLKSPLVMREIGTLQRTEVLKPGLFKALSELEAKLGNGNGNGSATEEKKAEGGEIGFTFSEKQEKRIQDKLRKEEERLHKRLLLKEQQIRERLAGRAEKRAARSGIKVEEAQGIVLLKESIKAKKLQIKAIRVEMKADREKLKELRPKRAKKEKKVEEVAQA